MVINRQVNSPATAPRAKVLTNGTQFDSDFPLFFWKFWEEKKVGFLTAYSSSFVAAPDRIPNHYCAVSPAMLPTILKSEHLILRKYTLSIVFNLE
jgi:hypothetical protein